MSTSAQISSKEHGPEVRVRFAPSPTGSLHIGGVRTALFNWLFARKHNGVFILRIEDTDKERSKSEYEDEIVEALHWFGLDWDEGIGKEKDGERYRQSERTALYREQLEKLLAAGNAYYCYCTKEDLEAQRQAMVAAGLPPRYNGQCRNVTAVPAGKSPQTIRLKTPETTVEFPDMIRGAVKFDAALLDDFVIAKNLDAPLYNFAVVIDDQTMRITHVIRGEEHLSNTPKQIVIQRALGFASPIFAHLPLILNAQRAKLSKREADVAALGYREKGYLPQAMINFLVLMGWHPSPDPETKQEKEIWTLEELIPAFDIDRVQKAGAVFDDQKLQWLNKEHIKKLSTDELEQALLPFFAARAMAIGSRERLHAIIDAVRDRMHTLVEFFDLADLFFALPEYPATLLRWSKGAAGESTSVLKDVRSAFEAVKPWDKDELTAALVPLIEKYGKGNVLWPVRVALSGKQNSPDPYVIATTLGQEEALVRLGYGIEKLSHQQEI